MTWLALILDGLAVYRLTRLVTADTLTQPWRDRIIRWSYLRWSDTIGPDEVAEDVMGSGSVQRMAEADEHEVPWLAQLISCRFCAGVWCAALVTAARWCVPTLWGPPAWGLAIACAAPLLARLED